MGFNILHALQTLLGHPQAPTTASSPRTFTASKTTSDVHSPAQIDQAIRSSAPLGTQPYGYNNTATPFLFNQVFGPAQSIRTNNAISALPTAPNIGGALPPAMVNVPWSSRPVPYSQSLNGPPH